MEAHVEIERKSDLLQELELELKRIQIQAFKDDISERRKYRKWAFIIAFIWMLSMPGIFIMSHFNGSGLAVISGITLTISRWIIITTKPLYTPNPKPTIFQILRNKLVNINS